jgi:uncharacterized membrane protein
MEPLIGLVLGTLVARLVGALGVYGLTSWRRAVACGLALMFTMTGMAHSVGLRDDLVAMVPPALPNPELLVTITGVMELAGAAALLVPRTAGPAAAALTGLLVSIFPANVYAATNDLAEGAQSMPLLPRTLMQVVFLAATMVVAWPWVTDQIRSRRSPEPLAAVRQAG